MLLLPDLEIRAHLSRYLAGSATLDEFEEWFIAETWDIEQSESSSAMRLAAEIRSALFDLTTGEGSEQEFRELARQRVLEVVANLTPEPRPASDDLLVEHRQAEPVLIGS